MKFLKLLSEQQKYVIKSLKRFVAEYHLLNDEQRLERSSKTLDILERYLSIEEGFVLDVLRFAPDLEKKISEVLAKNRDFHKKVRKQMERTVMIHVDEPDNAFKKCMLAILEGVQAHALYDRETFYPTLLEHLSPETREAIFKTADFQVKQDQLQASIPV